MAFLAREIRGQTREFPIFELQNREFTRLTPNFPLPADTAQPLLGGSVRRIVAPLRDIGDIGSQKSFCCWEFVAPQNQTDGGVIIQPRVFGINVLGGIDGSLDLVRIFAILKKSSHFHVAYDLDRKSVV